MPDAELKVWGRKSFENQCSQDFDLVSIGISGFRTEHASVNCRGYHTLRRVATPTQYTPLYRSLIHVLQA